MGLKTFIEHVGHDIKVAGKVVETDAKQAFVDLFGQQALTEIETTAATLLESQFGTAVLADAAELVGQVEAGTITLGSAVVTLASDVVIAAKKVGKEIENNLGTVVASLALAKASGALTAATAATASTAATTTTPPPSTTTAPATSTSTTTPAGTSAPAA